MAIWAYSRRHSYVLKQMGRYKRKYSQVHSLVLIVIICKYNMIITVGLQIKKVIYKLLC